MLRTLAQKMENTVLRDIAASLSAGAISTDEVIGWTDRRIAEHETPPYWLIELSTAVNPSRNDVLGFLYRFLPDRNVDDNSFLALTGYKFFELEHEPKTLIRSLYEHFCLQDRPSDETQGIVYMIDDEFNWNEALGIASLRNYLQPFLERGTAIAGAVRS